jgi:hypothetical protein
MIYDIAVNVKNDIPMGIKTCGTLAYPTRPMVDKSEFAELIKKPVYLKYMSTIRSKLTAATRINFLL